MICKLSRPPISRLIVTSIGVINRQRMVGGVQYIGLSVCVCLHVQLNLLVYTDQEHPGTAGTYI